MSEIQTHSGIGHIVYIRFMNRTDFGKLYLNERSRQAREFPRLLDFCQGWVICIWKRNSRASGFQTSLVFGHPGFRHSPYFSKCSSRIPIFISGEKLVKASLWTCASSTPLQTKSLTASSSTTSSYKKVSFHWKKTNNPYFQNEPTFAD